MAKKYKIRKYFTFDGKQYQVYGDTLEEVYEKKAKRLLELQEGRIEYSGKMLVKVWTEQALETYKVNVDEDNLKDMKYRINKHILSVIGDTPLKSVTPLQCQNILNAQIGMSASHIDKLYMELHFIFSTAVKNRLIQYDPTDSIVKPNGTKGHRRSLTKKETEHFLKVCDQDPGFILFELMYYCGCRPEEAMKVIGKDINKETHMLHIRGTKTDNSDRMVPIPAVLFDKARNTRPFDFVARNRADRPHTDSSYDRLSKALKRAMNISMGCKVYRNALIPPFPLADDFVPYDLRHTYCTNLARAGVDIRVAKKLMGHANISITADIYTHVDTKDIENAAELINRYIG